MSGGGQAVSDPQYELPQALITEDRLWAHQFDKSASFQAAVTRTNEREGSNGTGRFS